nr:phosphoinositide phospholipase C 2-like [Ipomoea batatas]
MSKQTYRICCFSRKFKLRDAEPPDEIKALFGRFSENGLMSAEHLHKFLKEVQGEESVSKEEAESAMEAALKSLEHLHVFHRSKGLNLESFFRYLFSETNSPLPPANKVHHDMNAPLSHYYIYTSHNTYLTGNQLNSDCSDVPIIKALERGVRVIELDMWPNSSKDNVDILHGGTLTTPVELIKCLKSIREHAFVSSEYPVIITLEDHLTPDLQAKVAEMVSQTFGDILFAPGSECLAEFPSPESLKRKIIISTKPPVEYQESKSLKDKDNSNSHSTKSASEENAWGKEISDLSHKFKALYENNKEDAADHECAEDDDSHHSNHGVPPNAAPEYKRLIAIQGGKTKGKVEQWINADPDKVRRVSLSEEKLESIVLTHGKEIIRFTQRNMLRIYPKGIRFDSSNYNPLIGWIHGAQMVAFNMQGYGRPLWLMQGMFRANGGCGYVKKPELLLNPNDVHDPKNLLPVKTTLKVKVYMGEGWHLDFKRTHFDFHSPPDFYVKIGIAGVPADSTMKKTKAIEDNWIPTWDEEFEFPLTVPELSLLRIEVHEYDMSEIDDFGGQTCLPVSELRTGVRAVALHDQKGQKYPSVKLLMSFDFVK